MDTKRFRTRTELIKRNNLSVPGTWEVALDIGYSAVKLFAPDKIACFPSYAKRVDPDLEFTSVIPDKAILYRNIDTDETWLVGEVAQDMIQTGDTTDSDQALFGRDRYDNAIFHVVMETGLGLACENNKDNLPIFVQTGLPEKYLKGDSADLRESIAGSHNFAIKRGNGEWRFFDFSIPSTAIDIMSQPKGTLFSICIDNDGKWVPQATDYLKSSLIIFDPGFGTLDLFPIYAGTVANNGETYPDLGMKRVFQETSKLIYNAYNADVSVAAMQRYLTEGVVRVFDRRKLESREEPFGEFLEKASTKVFNEAFSRMLSTINLVDYSYLVYTGGTGAAWEKMLTEKLSGIKTLKLIPGNVNDTLPTIYSNVRGYYMYRYNKLNNARKTK